LHDKDYVFMAIGAVDIGVLSPLPSSPARPVATACFKGPENKHKMSKKLLITNDHVY